jgi:hypothetical protein
VKLELEISFSSVINVQTLQKVPGKASIEVVKNETSGGTQKGSRRRVISAIGMIHSNDASAERQRRQLALIKTPLNHYTLEPSNSATATWARMATSRPPSDSPVSPTIQSLSHASLTAARVLSRTPAFDDPSHRPLPHSPPPKTYN